MYVVCILIYLFYYSNSNSYSGNGNAKRSGLRDSIDQAQSLKLGLDHGVLSIRSLSSAIESLRDLILIDSEISNRSCLAAVMDACFSFSGDRKPTPNLAISPRNNTRNGYSAINEDTDSVTLSVVNSPMTNDQYSKV